MSKPLIWLHDEALRINHPVFQAAPPLTQAIYVWDNNYFETLGYSLKRLVFIYETLCELPVDIVQGETPTIIKALAPSVIYLPATNKPHLVAVIRSLKPLTEVEVIDDKSFVEVDREIDFRRFFPFWKLAEKDALCDERGHT
jgi:hypothetical protein